MRLRESTPPSEEMCSLLSMNYSRFSAYDTDVPIDD